jgi:uroporphyrin-III C-methyltransferase
MIADRGLRHPVHLVGAGPGDPELLTLKAVRVLQQASVILVDDLVGEQVIESVLPAATRTQLVVHVGKRGGCTSTPQAFIERLMVREALAGERVVRLKGGDPLVFGRAAEEMAALRCAGLEMIVVNGITSGLSAATALGVSWTDRRCDAQGVLLVTGQCRPGSAGPDWQTIGRLARDGTSGVSYMGLSRCGEWVARLQESLPHDWPAGAVERAGSRDERVHVSTLSGLSALIERQAIRSPAAIVIGRVLEAAWPIAAWSGEPLPSRVAGA